MKVRWITGRRDALVSGLALSMCEARGDRWFDLSSSEQAVYLHDAQRRVADWVAHDVLLEFENEFRERRAVDDSPFRERK